MDLTIKSNATVSPFSGDFDEIRTFEVVSLDSHGYYLYIPPYLSIKSAVVMTARECRALKIDPRFADESILYISDSLIYKVNSVLDGIACLNCQEFCQYAQPNQEDGSFYCYQCRFNPWR